MSLCHGASLVGTSGVNGDSYFISANRKTFLVADGASGAGDEGKVLMSSLCVEQIKANPFPSSGLPAKAWLDRMIWQINNALIGASQKSGRYLFGTLVICVVQGNTATVASIGDSPAYLIHGDGIERVAKPRKRYQNLVDMGLYSEEELDGAVHKLPEHLWSMFDQFIPMVVPAYAVEERGLEQGDALVLCCDGISDYLAPAQIRDTINAGDLPDSVNALIQGAKDRSIQERQRVQYDDLTVVAYRHAPTEPTGGISL